MHNSHWPANITDHGRIGRLDGIRLTHNGWSTLEERIARVRHYMRLDPDFRHNFGVAYDRSLLFGYALEEVDVLKADYRRRVRGDFDRTEPGRACRSRRSHARSGADTDPARTVSIPGSTSPLTPAARSTPSYPELFAAQAKSITFAR